MAITQGICTWLGLRCGVFFVSGIMLCIPSAVRAQASDADASANLSENPAAKVSATRVALSDSTPAQVLDPSPKSQAGAGLLNDPTLEPGRAFLFALEARFARATAEGGGKAFATFFAEDGVALSNGKAAVVGQAAIAAQSTWSPKDYQLTWTPQGGSMGAAGDMGFTWGHYEGRTKDRAGNPVVTGGRYMTVWRKQADGSWKAIMDASNEEPAAAGECCRVP